MKNTKETAVHVLDVVQLKEYCARKSTIPADDHEAFVAFYKISGSVKEA